MSEGMIEPLGALIVATGPWGERVYADEAPAGSPTPHVVIMDDLGNTTQLLGDRQTIARRRMAQFDVYFADALSEDPDAITALRDALDGARLDGHLTVRVNDVIRRQDPDTNEISYTFDLRASYLT